MLFDIKLFVLCFYSPQQPSPTQAAKIADGSVTPAAVTERDDDVTARDTAFPSAPA